MAGSPCLRLPVVVGRTVSTRDVTLAREIP
jgi:hypothetical protein